MLRMNRLDAIEMRTGSSTARSSTLTRRVRNTQKALDCRHDFLTISASIARLAGRLRQFYPFEIRLRDGTVLRAEDRRSLEQVFTEDYLAKAQRFIMSSLPRSGSRGG